MQSQPGVTNLVCNEARIKDERVLYFIQFSKEIFLFFGKLAAQLSSNFLFGKTLNKDSMEGTFLNIIIVTHDKSTANNIIFSGKKVKALPLRSEIRQRCLLSPLLFKIVLEVLDRTIQQ